MGKTIDELIENTKKNSIENALFNIVVKPDCEEELDKVFKKAGQIKTELSNKYKLDLKELSMGMSDDYERAVADGATMIRLGRILFK